MTISLVADRDIHSTPTWAFQLTDDTYAATLPADTNVQLTVPAGAYVALIAYSPGQNVLVNNGTVITAAPGATFTQKAQEQLMPAVLNVSPSDVLNFWSVGDTAIVYVGFYKN